MSESVWFFIITKYILLNFGLGTDLSGTIIFLTIIRIYSIAVTLRKIKIPEWRKISVHLLDSPDILLYHRP